MSAKPGLLYFAKSSAAVKEGARLGVPRTVTASRDAKIDNGEDFQAFHPAAGDGH